VSSNPDTFIDEVTEAVRRDRLYGLLKKYGWIGVLAVLVIVGGTAWIEFAASRHESRSAAFGDAVIAAMGLSDPAERAAALARIEPSTGDQAALQVLFSASTPADADRLAALYADTKLPPAYRHLAQFRRLLRSHILSAKQIR